MKESKKSFILEALGSLFSNEKAISCSKKSPIWLTILLFFVAVILPVIPLTVSTANSYGSSFIDNYSSVFEKTMPKIALDMAKDNLTTLTVDENYELNINDNDTSASYKYVNEVTGRIDMQVFFSCATTDTTRAIYINAAPVSTTYKLDETDDASESYHPNFTIFFRNAIYCCIFKADTTETLTYSAVGDYKSFEPGTNLVELLTTVDGTKLTPTSDTEVKAIVADSAKNDAILGNWKTLFNKSYLKLREKNTWMSSLIYLGIYAGLSLIMGFLIWVMTRGKSNPFSYLSLWACLKMEAWASVAPGLIGLILGLFMTSYAVMIFIMCLGMRIMWISMKQLRPEIQQ